MFCLYTFPLARPAKPKFKTWQSFAVWWSWFLETWLIWVTFDKKKNTLQPSKKWNIIISWKNFCESGFVKKHVMNSLSDSETVPKILPQHIRTSPYLIPRETNAFLCQLLEVKMRELFPCIPYPMVKPRVSLPKFPNFVKCMRPILIYFKISNVSFFQNVCLSIPLWLAL